MTYYRIQERDRDPADLLLPQNWTSTVWVGEVYRPCPACDGAGYDIVDEQREDCPDCDGSGEVDDSTRRGVSCCRSLADLYAYFASRSATLDDVVVIELEGTLSEDEDWDADEGAVLVYPTRIVSAQNYAERA